MCTLCLSDMGELRDDWLRPVVAQIIATRVIEPLVTPALSALKSRAEIAEAA